MSAGLLMFVLAALLGVASYNFICVGADIPTGQTSKMMMLSGKRDGTKGESLGDVYLAKVASLFTRFIKLDPLKQAQLDNALSIAKINMTPEAFISTTVARALLITAATLPICLINPLFGLVGIAIGSLSAFMKHQEVLDHVKKRRKRIESEIPRFATSIAQGLEIDRDILRMLIAYRRVADKDFAAELGQTIADMKTGNYENALLKLERRIGSPLMSDVVRGLIGTLRGDDQRVYFKMICFDMRQLEQNYSCHRHAKAY